MKLSWILLVLLALSACTNKEQVYEGLYKGLGVVQQNRQIENPSYDLIQKSGDEQLNYQQYKREREKELRGDTSS